MEFDASASSDRDGSIDSYSWDFDDGDTDVGPTPTHKYTSAGSYTVTLTVTDDQGARDTVTEDVTVTSPPADPGAGDGVSPGAPVDADFYLQKDDVAPGTTEVNDRQGNPKKTEKSSSSISQ